ncbi:MAG: YigZ family protein [Oceanihabitans sp.]|nr:YigZ family protein [Oceanihabitans sp.]
MEEKDTYKTITTPSEAVLFKDKNSKFYGYAFPIQNEEEVKQHLEDLKKQHHTAGHFCYAYQFGTDEKNISYRANDDGEPNNSAGMPIYGQIQSYDVTNILIVVLRYYGGVKLGVGGLINAYRTGAQMALEASKIITKTINIAYCISFEYKNMNKVMRIIKEKNLNITNQILELDCKVFISVRKNNSESVFETFDNQFEIKIEVV